MLIAALLFLSGSEASGKMRLATTSGEQSVSELPDGSTITLDANSTATWDPVNWEGQREIVLQGAAFFKVKEGSRFDVQTRLGTVSVLGTEFDIRHREEVLQVRCFSGKVRVAGPNDAELAILTKGKGIRLAQGMTENIVLLGQDQPSWTKGEFRFQSADYHEVLAEFEHQFGLRVEVPDMAGRKYTGGFSRSPAEDSRWIRAAPSGQQDHGRSTPNGSWRNSSGLGHGGKPGLRYGNQ